MCNLGLIIILSKLHFLSILLGFHILVGYVLSIRKRAHEVCMGIGSLNMYLVFGFQETNCAPRPFLFSAKSKNIPAQ